MMKTVTNGGMVPPSFFCTRLVRLYDVFISHSSCYGLKKFSVFRDFNSDFPFFYLCCHSNFFNIFLNLLNFSCTRNLLYFSGKICFNFSWNLLRICLTLLNFSCTRKIALTFLAPGICLTFLALCLEFTLSFSCFFLVGTRN